MPGAGAADRRLLMLVEKGDLTGVKKLLGGGADVNGSRWLDLRPLISAARTGNTTMIKLLISSGADLEVEARIPEGGRAMHAVISSENPEALRALIEAGASVNSRDGDGLTALMNTALATTGVGMARQLFDAGADPNIRNLQGMSALHVAAGLGNTHVMEVIMANAPFLLNAPDGRGFSPMGIAALKRSRRAVSCLLASGASDERAHEDQAAIFWAAEGAVPNMVRMMLRYPIDRVGGLRAIPNSMGVAIQGKQARMLDMLLSVQGDENRQKWAEWPVKGGTPLALAVAWVSLRAVHVLLEAGADETRIDRHGKVADSIGAAVNPKPSSRVFREEMASCRRMLERGPAFRARSYGWSAQVIAAGDGNPPSEVVISSKRKAEGSLGVRVFRRTGAIFFTQGFSRYAKK
eukprot:g13333.t1